MRTLLGTEIIDEISRRFSSPEATSRLQELVDGFTSDLPQSTRDEVGDQIRDLYGSGISGIVGLLRSRDSFFQDIANTEFRSIEDIAVPLRQAQALADETREWFGNIIERAQGLLSNPDVLNRLMQEVGPNRIEKIFDWLQRAEDRAENISEWFGNTADQVEFLADNPDALSMFGGDPNNIEAVLGNFEARAQEIVEWYGNFLEQVGARLGVSVDDMPVDQSDGGDTGDTTDDQGTPPAEDVVVGTDNAELIDLRAETDDQTIEARGGNDVVIGGVGNDIIDGGTGADVLFGGDGDDTFAFKAGGANFGSDTVSDFQPGAGTDDVIQFEGSIFTNFQDVLNAATEVGDDVVIDAGNGNTVRIERVDLSMLHEDDFTFF